MGDIKCDQSHEDNFMPSSLNLSQTRQQLNRSDHREYVADAVYRCQNKNAFLGMYIKN